MANQETVSQTKPTLSFWQIWNMCFGFLGIQFGWALQMGNMSAIYDNLGAKPDEIPGLWLAAPLTGLLVQPVIGYLSDRTWTPLGRRKPYFLVGAILSSIALFFMPYSSTVWMAAGLLWILDASINISMEPFRAFVADILPKEQQTRGYTMQSFFIGVGAVVASLLPWLFTNVLKISNVAQKGSIPLNVKLSFAIGAVAFFSAVLYTILKTKEYPPEDMEAFLAEKNKTNSKGLLARIIEAAKEIIQDIFTMPKVMRQLSLVQFFTWPGLFLMWFYFVPGITRSVFKYQDMPDAHIALYKAIPAGADPASVVLPDSLAAVKTAVIGQYGGLAQFTAAMAENDKRKGDGGDWGNLCFGFYSIITFIFALFLPRISSAIGKKRTHFWCLIAGAVGLIIAKFLSGQYLLLLSMTGVGIAWASILSMPYSMLVNHLPKEKTGVYVGIFNFFIVIPEIIATLCFGWVMRNILHNNQMDAVVIGGGLLALAAVLCLFVKDDSK